MPEQCVVVEDAVAGVAAAKRAGMKCIAVTTTHPRSALSTADMLLTAWKRSLQARSIKA